MNPAIWITGAVVMVTGLALLVNVPRRCPSCKQRAFRPTSLRVRWPGFRNEGIQWRCRRCDHTRWAEQQDDML